MKRILLAVLALMTLACGCGQGSQTGAAHETSRVSSAEKEALWESYYEILRTKTLLEHTLDAQTIAYGAVAEIRPSFQVKWQSGGDVGGTSAFTPVEIAADTYYTFESLDQTPDGREVFLVQGEKNDNPRASQQASLQLELGDEVFVFIGKPALFAQESAVFPVWDGKIRVHTDMLPAFAPPVEEAGWIDLPLEQFEEIIVDIIDRYA